MKKTFLLLFTCFLPHVAQGAICELSPQKIRSLMAAGLVHQITTSPNLSKSDASKLYIAHRNGIKAEYWEVGEFFASVETREDVEEVVRDYAASWITSNGMYITWYYLDNSSGKYSFKDLKLIHTTDLLQVTTGK